MPALLIVVLVLFALVALTVIAVPLSLVQRYRAGTKRRVAREWVSTINIFSLVFSAALLLAGAAITNLWMPRAFLYTAGGLAAGGLLGLLGLAATRWEIAHSSVHYTPSRILVAAILLVVTARLIFGFWRSWILWRSEGEFAWVAASGAAASLGAGAIIVGYYLSYFYGIRRRAGRHRSSNPARRS